MNEQIVTLAQTISGAAEAEQALLEQLCAASAREWESRLQEGVAPEDCGAAFVCAAALSAAAGLSTARSGGDTITSFKAGQISVSGMAAAEIDSAANGLRLQAEMLMAPFIRDDQFCFKGVPG